jgi:hypothetical protein
MAGTPLEDSHWSALLGRLSTGIDVGGSARATGAFVRARGVPSAEALLRLALIYGATDLSLRGTAAWAEAAGMARLSDVALLGRLQAASGWLARLASSLMTAARDAPTPAGRRVRLIDATSFGRDGDTQAAAWRVHADYDLERERFIGFELTDEREAERLTRFATAPGDILIGDRVYGQNAEALRRIREAGGDFVLRRGLTSCRLLHKDGGALDPSALLARTGHGDTIEIAVLVANPDGDPLPARLVIHHMPKDFARRARARAASTADWTAREKRLKAAEYVMLLTSLPRRSFPAPRLLALYRLRWQIEIAFKRLKSLVGLDRLQAKERRLARAAISAKLIIALLTEDLLAKVLDSPPSEPRGAPRQMAPLPDNPRSPAPGRTRHRHRIARRPPTSEGQTSLQKSRRAKATAKATGS